MAWIESHTVLLRHRKVLQLAADLQILPVQAVGHLHVLWHAVLEQQEDGDLREWPDEMIAQAAAYSGDASAFVAALQSRKWLDGKIVHDWIDYAGLYLTKKYSTSNVKILHEIWKVHGCKYGKRDNKSLHLIANRKRTESELKANLPNLTRPNQTEPNQPDLTRPEEIKICAEVPKPRTPPKSAATHEAYREAYQGRYGVDPVRNQQTNSMLCRLVDKLGQDEAPQVARFYLTHNNPFYVAKRHPVNLLLADAEGLRTQWATGTKATTSEAKNAEFKDNVVSQADRIIANMQRKGRL